MAADTTTDAPTDGEVTEYLIKISKHNELNRLMICGIIHTKVSRIQVVDWNEFISKGLVDEQELVDIFLLLIGSSVKSVIFHIELNDVKIEELFKKLRESGIFVGYRIGYGYNNEEEIEQCGLDYLEFKHLPEIGRCLTVTAIKI